MNSFLKRVGATAVITLVTGNIMVFEGLPTNKQGLHPVYYDSAGVKTACYGETKGLKKQYYSTEECASMLGQSLKGYSTALDGLPQLPTVVYAGALDFTYNAGTEAFRSSQVRQCLMKEDLQCASKAVLNWRFISRKESHPQFEGWVYNAAKKRYYYDCSQLIDGKPNKVCYGVWTRRLLESELLSGKLTPEEATSRIKAEYGHRGS